MRQSVTLPVGITQLPDPYPVLGKIRSAGHVVAVATNDSAPTWLVSGYDEVRAALSDHRLSSDPTKDRRRGNNRLASHVSRATFPHSMFTTDPPDHTRLRAAVQPLLTRQRMDTLRPYIERTADSLLDANASTGRIDAVDDLAAPLAVRTICHLLGLPTTDHRSILNWSRRLMTEQTDEHTQLISRAGGEALTAWTTTSLADGPSGLIRQLRSTAPEHRLTDEEIITTATLLLVAGHETSVSLMTSAIRWLLCHPSTSQLLRGQPRLIPSAVAEVLRFDGPVIKTVRRIATADVALGQETIRRGDHVFACVAAANRDERQFCAANELIPDRQPNPHLAFGYGIHRCPGAALGLLEAQILMEVLIRNTRHVSLAAPVEQLRWRAGQIRSLEHLPLTVSIGAPTPARKGRP